MDRYRLKEVARDVSPILMVIAFLVMICLLIMGVIGILAKDASANGSTQKPDSFEVIEENSAYVTTTFCSHGARIWVTRLKQGAVAMNTLPGQGC